MKERPILFTPENAQKSHDGLKTETRRLNGLEQFNAQPDRWRLEGDTFVFDGGFEYVPVPRCPYGGVGDRLWVREAWRVTGGKEYEYQQRIEDVHYRGDINESIEFGPAKWRPSIHMPRWACRTVLELTGVRVERLQDCSEADARAEGAAFVCELCGCDLDTDHGAAVHFACDDPDCERASHREGFMRLWESINGAGSWDANPWVWVLEFRRVTHG